ncbi:lactonase family protein [Candidimonas nitroreducens]|uniref:3-carboxymuconate cyclase n=1 Tax=Candidimonas nitroreducens TaxID=683354 RepID=A0A225MHD3_9BURK|nr:beta-propeller fold lactonase family protein [Candidimonas nitroreducens]OWT60302.1 3-carboxymuconate cyclase [Candidimonas nitroreducens]
MPAKLALYSAVGAVLTHYDVDVDAAELHERASITLPAKVQYAWRHPRLPILYCTVSDGGPRVPSGNNQVVALDIAADGTLRRRGTAAELPRRAVHMCVDPAGRHVINAHNYDGGSLSLHRLDADGSLGGLQVQSPRLNYGIYPHQVRVFPSGRTVLIVDRGNKAQAGKPEDPGALRTFPMEDGMLAAGQAIAPDGGYGFGPRHVDFHPGRPWIYVSDERMNRLYMFRYSDGDRIDSLPAYTRDTLADPENVRPRQIGGPIHVHPAGRAVYVANRADHTVEHHGEQVFGGGENNIAVYAIDPQTGEPRLAQHAETHSFHVRTFACDPDGRLLVTASIKALNVVDGGELQTVPAALSVFRVADDGCLSFVHKVDVATQGSQLQYWTGMVRVG